MPIPYSEAEFFGDITKLGSDCWRHNGPPTGTKGHRQTRTGEGTHRWAYSHFKGEIPKGQIVHHICENPWCVNPDHLQTMTSAEHTYLHAGSSADFFACGHERKDNEYVQMDGTVKRVTCLICRNTRNKNKSSKVKNKSRDEYKAWLKKKRLGK